MDNLLPRLKEILKTSYGYLQPKDRDDLSAIVVELEAEEKAAEPPAEVHNAALPPNQPEAGHFGDPDDKGDEVQAP